jgi:hypothetical protein
VQKNREKEKKERELVIQKQRREQRKREREAKEAEERLQRQKSLKEAAAQNANDDRYIYIKFIVVQSYLLGGAALPVIRTRYIWLLPACSAVSRKKNVNKMSKYFKIFQKSIFLHTAFRSQFRVCLHKL